MDHSGPVQGNEAEENTSFDAEFPDVSDYFTLTSELIQTSVEPAVTNASTKAPQHIKSVSSAPLPKQVVFDLTGSDDDESNVQTVSRSSTATPQPHVINLLNSPDDAPRQQQKGGSIAHATRSSTRAQRQDNANHSTRTFLQTMLASLPSLFQSSPSLPPPCDDMVSDSPSDTRASQERDIVMLTSSSSCPTSSSSTTLPILLYTTPFTSASTSTSKPKSKPKSKSKSTTTTTDIAMQEPANLMDLTTTTVTPAESSSPSFASIQCRICLDRITQPAATDCGHVFCHSCLSHAISSQGKCPLCRKSLSLKKIRRLYL